MERGSKSDDVWVQDVELGEIRSLKTDCSSDDSNTLVAASNNCSSHDGKPLYVAKPRYSISLWMVHVLNGQAIGLTLILAICAFGTMGSWYWHKERTPILLGKSAWPPEETGFHELLSLIFGFSMSTVHCCFFTIYRAHKNVISSTIGTFLISVLLSPISTYIFAPEWFSNMFLRQQLDMEFAIREWCCRMKLSWRGSFPVPYETICLVSVSRSCLARRHHGYLLRCPVVYPLLTAVCIRLDRCKRRFPLVACNLHLFIPHHAIPRHSTLRPQTKAACNLICLRSGWAMSKRASLGSGSEPHRPASSSAQGYDIYEARSPLTVLTPRDLQHSNP